LNQPLFGASPNAGRRGGKGVQPEPEGRQPRERGVARAQQHGHQQQPEALHDRDGEQQQHRGPVLGEQLLVGLWAEDALLRRRELHPQQQRGEPRQGEEAEGGHDEPRADGLVASLAQPGRRTSRPRATRSGDRFGGDAHRRLSR
jgi:hypothetical protein